MSDIPADAPRSADGYYWWDEQAQDWRAVADQDAASSSTTAGAASADGGSAGTERTGTITAQPGIVLDLSYAHDDVVAMVEQSGAELPRQSGEAMA